MILLTGASGFIGKSLLNALAAKYGKAEVLALTSKPVKDYQYILHEDYTFDKDYFSKCGYGEKIELLVHAGAFTPKNSSQANLWQECNKNIASLDRLLKAELPHLKKIIYLSTLDVYDEPNIISEDSPINPVSLYGHSKLYGEKLVEAWGTAVGKSVQILRIGHVYGPGEESYQKIIPVAFRKTINEENIEIFGTGDELRAFIYIGDVVKAILNALELVESVGPINLVSSQAISISELVAKIIKLSGKSNSFKITPTSTLGRNFVFNNLKMQKYLLPSEIPLEEGLVKEWQYMLNL
jgi:UDP-glucose 4-epimerase